MDTAGQRLKRVREKLQLRYREVEKASHELAARRGNSEFMIALSRLADIENKGVVPTIYRLYALCAIYRLDFNEVLSWYGVELAGLLGDGTAHQATHVAHLPEGVREAVAGAAAVLPEMTRVVDTEPPHRLVAGVMGGYDPQRYRFGYMGLRDFSMYPVLHPGALLMIDLRQRKVAAEGWRTEFERPIYFLEHRGGYCCGWCTMRDDHLVVQSHPASQQPAQVYRYPNQIEVVGRVVGVAMPLGSRGKRVRNAASPAASPDR